MCKKTNCSARRRNTRRSARSSTEPSRNLPVFKRRQKESHQWTRKDSLYHHYSFIIMVTIVISCCCRFCIRLILLLSCLLLSSSSSSSLYNISLTYLMLSCRRKRIQPILVLTHPHCCLVCRCWVASCEMTHARACLTVLQITTIVTHVQQNRNIVDRMFRLPAESHHHILYYIINIIIY